MSLLLSMVGLLVFVYLTDISSASMFNSIFCPIAAGLCVVIILAKFFGSSGGPGSGSGGGFFGGPSGGDYGGGDGGGC